MAPDYLELIETYRLAQPRALKYILKPLTSIPVNGFFSALDLSNKGCNDLCLNISIPQMFSAFAQKTLMPESAIKQYFETIAMELVQLATYTDRERKVVKLCIKGAGANSYASEYLEELIEVAKSEFTISKEVNLEIVCGPEQLTNRRIDDLRRIGFNSLTINQYDFNADILSAAKKNIKNSLSSDQIGYIRKRGKISINLVLSYGMPPQTADGFIDSLEKALALAPDRLYLTPFCTNNVEYGTMQRTNLHSLTGNKENTALLMKAYFILTHSGYSCRNLFLYSKAELPETVDKNPQLINLPEISYPISFGIELPSYGIGAGAASFFSGCYFINEPDLKLYESRVTSGLPATKDGLMLNKSSQVCLEAAGNMALKGVIDLKQLAKSCLLSIRETESVLQKGFPVIDLLFKKNILIRDGQFIRACTPALGTILMQELQIE